MTKAEILFAIAIITIAVMVIWIGQTNKETMNVCQEDHSFDTCWRALNP